MDLQEGFDGDRVVIRVAGGVVYDVDGVTTDPLLGVADSAEVEVAGEDPVALTVELPERGLSATTQVATAAAPYLGVRAGRDGLTFVTSPQPFGYA